MTSDRVRIPFVEACGDDVLLADLMILDEALGRRRIGDKRLWLRWRDCLWLSLLLLLLLVTHEFGLCGVRNATKVHGRDRSLENRFVGVDQIGLELDAVAELMMLLLLAHLDLRVGQITGETFSLDGRHTHLVLAYIFHVDRVVVVVVVESAQVRGGLGMDASTANRAAVIVYVLDVVVVAAAAAGMTGDLEVRVYVVRVVKRAAALLVVLL